jgi:hypothetical protein
MEREVHLRQSCDRDGELCRKGEALWAAHEKTGSMRFWQGCATLSVGADPRVRPGCSAKPEAGTGACPSLSACFDLKIIQLNGPTAG